MPFPYSLPLAFGEDVASTFTKITDHAASAVSLLIEQYRDKPLLSALARISGERTQLLEDQLWKIFTERWIESAEGTQLDNLGKIVGQPRQAFADEDYRQQLRARVRLNRSSGTIEDLLAIFRLVVPPGTGLQMIERFPAGFRLQLNDMGFNAASIALLLGFMRAARAGGVYGVLHWITTTEAATFTFDGGAGLGFGDATDPSVGGELAGISP